MFVGGRVIDSSRKKKSEKTIRGTVFLVKKNVLDISAIHKTVADGVFELLGQGVTLQLVSAENIDPENGKGMVGKAEALENWNLAFSPPSAGRDDSLYKVSFEWDEDFGTPGAVIVRNNDVSDFFKLFS